MNESGSDNPVISDDDRDRVDDGASEAPSMGVKEQGDGNAAEGYYGFL